MTNFDQGGHTVTVSLSLSLFFSDETNFPFSIPHGGNKGTEGVGMGVVQLWKNSPLIFPPDIPDLQHWRLAF